MIKPIKLESKSVTEQIYLRRLTEAITFSAVIQFPHNSKNREADFGLIIPNDLVLVFETYPTFEVEGFGTFRLSGIESQYDRENSYLTFRRLSLLQSLVFFLEGIIMDEEVLIVSKDSVLASVLRVKKLSIELDSFRKFCHSLKKIFG